MLAHISSENIFHRQHTGLGYEQVRVRDTDSDDMLYLSPARTQPNERQRDPRSGRSEAEAVAMAMAGQSTSSGPSGSGRLVSRLFPPRTSTYDAEGNLRQTWPGLGAIVGEAQQLAGTAAASGDGDLSQAVYRHRKHVEPMFPRDLRYWRDVDERALLDAKEGVYPTVTLDADVAGLSTGPSLTQMQTHTMNQVPGVAVGRLPSSLARMRFSRQLRALRGEPNAAMSTSEKPGALRVLQGHRRWVHMPTFEDVRRRFFSMFHFSYTNI